MTSPRHRIIKSISSSLAVGTAAAVAMGVADLIFTLGRASDLQTGAADVALGSLYAAGLLTLLTLPLAAVFGLALGLTNVDIGPIGVGSALVHLARARGERAAALTGSLWASGVALLLGYGGIFKIGHTIMLTFHNELLSALLLAAAALGWTALAYGVYVTLRGAISSLAHRIQRDERPSVGSPLVPVVLAVLGVVALLGVVPYAFEETWDALDLRIPVGMLALFTLIWAGATLTARWLRPRPLGRSLLVGALGLVLGLGGLFLPTLLTFGTSDDQAGLSVALAEKSMVSRVPLRALQSRFDADGDGYASRLGGGDCNDESRSVFPGADEIIGNGVDEDCDGDDLVLPTKSKAAPKAGGDKSDKSAPAADPLSKLRKRYNVVTIIIDTVRPDRVGWAGYERPTTPNLDKLAARSTIFENAYSVSAKTPTAVPPIFAGRYPSEMPRSFHHFVYYDSENTFLPETLSDTGYLTSASGAHWYFLRKYGYDQGFQRWSTYMVEGDEMERIPTSAQVTDKAIEMLDAMAAGKLAPKGNDDEGMPEQLPPLADGGVRPFYLMVHYLDPHKHYINHEGFEPFGKGPSARYDGEIRFVDHHFGRLYERLLHYDPDLSNTVIVVFSDHGEAFGEHEMRFHGWDLYEHQIKVPFLMHMPGGPAQRIRERVSLIDLAPTVLDVLGIDAPETYRGTSLLPQVAVGKKLEQRPIFTEMPPGPYNVHFRSLTVGNTKLIHRLHGNFYRLFDLDADPGELNNIMKSKPERAKELKDAYNIFRAQNVVQVEASKNKRR